MNEGLTTTTHDLAELLLPIRLQHLVCLVDDRVPIVNQHRGYDEGSMSLLDTAHGKNARLVHKVTQAAWRRDEDVATLAELLDRDLHWESAVYDARTKHAAVRHATSLVKNLHGKLAGGHDHNDQRLSADLFLVVDVWLWCTQLLRLAHQPGQDWDHVGSGFAGA